MLGFQYRGLAPTDPEPMEWFALAETTDTPIGVHVGPGPPGAPFVASPNYRARLSSPLPAPERRGPAPPPFSVTPCERTCREP